MRTLSKKGTSPTSKTLLQPLFFLLFCSTALLAQAQPPALLKDINVSKVSGSPRGMTTVGTSVFFSATDGLHGRELWKTEGGSSTTLLVKDIHLNGSSNPTNLCNVNGTLFFTATDGAANPQLWKSNGTAAGTVFVALPVAGANNQFSQLTACNGKLFFSALRRTITPVGVIDELKLYVSDGTTAGTKVLGSVLTNPQNLTAVGNTLFFSATSTNGTELWKTDGTELGTQLVKNINTTSPTASSNPRLLVNAGGTLFFTADNGTHGRQVWQSGGTDATTSRVSLLQSAGVNGSEIAEMAAVGSTVFFSAPSGVLQIGTELHRVNSGANSTTKIGGVIVKNLTACNGKLFFTQETQLTGPILSSVPTNSTTITEVKTFSTALVSIPQNLIAVGTTLFFTAATTAEGRELWKSNGTTAGTVVVQDLAAGSANANISDFCVRSGVLFFAGDDNSDGNELRRSDGTVNGILQVRNIGRGGSFPSGFTQMGNKTFFAADNGSVGRELWVSDGTEAGTQLLKDLRSGASGSEPDNFFVINSTLFFVANDGSTGRELWKSDGTAAGTVRISDIVLGPNNGGIGNLTNVNGVLHFSAASGLSTGDRIFKTNAALTGVVTTGGSLSNANSLVASGSTLFFTQSPQIGGPQLCKLVNGATTVVKTYDLIPGGEYPVPQKLTVVGGTLFFTAATAAHGRELWKSNGTAAGTVRISDIRPNAESSGIGNLTNVNGTLHFTAASGTSLGNNLFKVNTLATGVENVATSEIGVFDLEAAGATLFYFKQVLSPTDGPTLCKLQNGVVTELKTFENQPFSQAYSPLTTTAAGGVLYFQMGDATNGQELWKSDGTAAGTTLVSDLRPGVASSNIREMKVCGSNLFFSANNLTSGQEPFVLANVVFAEEAADDRTDEAEEAAETVAATPELQLSPNPATTYVNIDLTQTTSTGTLSIFDLSGRLVHESIPEPGETRLQVSLSDLPKGLYLVRWVQEDQQVATRKLVIQ